MAAPIPLPPQILHPVTIALPAPPANPPSAADYARALDYVKRVDIAKSINEATITQQMEAHQYLYLIGAAVNLPIALQLPTVQPQLQTALSANLQAALPAALQASLQAALQAALPGALQATLPGALQASLPAALKAPLAELYIMSAQVHNRQAGDGTSIPFREVRFPNGDHPTQAPYNLPLLSSVTVINHLLAVDMVAYISNYNPGVNIPINRSQRIHMIKLAICCVVL